MNFVKSTKFMELRLKHFEGGITSQRPLHAFVKGKCGNHCWKCWKCEKHFYTKLTEINCLSKSRNGYSSDKYLANVQAKLCYKSYNLQFSQALRHSENEHALNCCLYILKAKEGGRYCIRHVFSDSATCFQWCPIWVGKWIVLIRAHGV